MSDPLNIASLLDQHARARPRYPAIIWRDETISYERLAATVRRQANLLVAAGIGPGDVVGLCLSDTPEHLQIIFAIARIGAITLPMDARWTTPEIGRMAAHFHPALIVTDRDMTGLTPSIRILRIDDAWREQAAMAADEAPVILAKGEPLLVSLSSGTTGRPTGPLLRHDQMFARFVSQTASLGFNSEDRFMTATPLYFGGGRTFSMAQLAIGATLVLQCPPYKPEALAKAVGDHGVTAMFLVPTILRRLLTLDTEALAPFRGLRQLISSGAPLHLHEREAVRTRMTPNYYEYYASTEGGGVSILSPADQHEHPASVGRPLFRVEVELVDDDHKPLPSGQVGAVRYRGPGVAEGFFRDPENSATAFRDGWFYPGDLGEMDDEGFLSLRGRKKDVIIRGGVNIYPLEVEQVVTLMHEVADACVFPMPDAQFGEEVALVYVATPGADIDGLDERIRAYCAASIAPYKTPTRIFRLDSFPRNSGGKVVRAAVVEAALDSEI